MFPGVSPDWFEGFKLLLSCFRLDVCTSTLQQLPALSGPHGWPKNQGWWRGIMEAARQWNRFASTLILVLEPGRVLTALQQVRVLAAARHGTAWYVSVFKSDCFRLLGDYRESLFCNPGFSEHCWIHKKMVLRWDAKTCLGAHEPKDPEAEGDQKRRGLSHNCPKSFFAEISLVVSCVRSQIMESFCFLYFFVVGKRVLGPVWSNDKHRPRVGRFQAKGRTSGASGSPPRAQSREVTETPTRPILKSPEQCRNPLGGQMAEAVQRY